MFIGQTSYCMNPRANAYIFSEYNLFDSCKNPMQVKLGAVKSFNDVLNGCKGDMDGTVVTDKSTKVNTDCQFANFDTDAAVSYIPSGDYVLHTDTSKLASYFETYGGTMDETKVVNGTTSADGTPVQPSETPSEDPTEAPTQVPSENPTDKPSENPTDKPSENPTDKPSENPTDKPSENPTDKPSENPTDKPSEQPSETPVAMTKCGDVNGDDAIDIMDVIALNKYILGSMKLDDQAKANADADGNGTLDSTDSLNILKYVVELITELPVK